MVSDDQTAVVTLLQDPATHGGRPVERIDTHSAIVFLVGALAYKLKRAVRFDYLDFSSRERRRAMCDAELLLNRRLAPSVYRRVVPVTRSGDGTLAIDGDGEPIDWLLEMNRFDSAMLLDRLAATRHLEVDLLRALGPAIAGFHARAAVRQDHGGPAAMAWVIEGNAVGLNEFGRHVFPAGSVERLTAASRKALRDAAPLLERRRLGGFVRQCHGDLHLGNIVIIDGRPTPFDGIEFNDEVSCIDVLYDVAFLLTDLWHRDLTTEANIVFNSYVEATGDIAGLALLPLFMSCRAAIRAKTSVTTASVQEDPEKRARCEQEARQYLELAERLLRPVAPPLIAVGGYSGSGKSTLAFAVASEVGRAPGAVVIRSDELRKRVCGVEPLQALGPAGYVDEVTDEVYTKLTGMARSVVRTGQAAIADAVFGRRSRRDAIERVASQAQVEFLGLWLDAPEATLVHRVEHRQGDASDATAEIVQRQRCLGTGRIDWLPIDTLLPLHRSVETVRALLSTPALVPRQESGRRIAGAQ